MDSTALLDISTAQQAVLLESIPIVMPALHVQLVPLLLLDLLRVVLAQQEVIQAQVPLLVRRVHPAKHPLSEAPLVPTSPVRLDSGLVEIRVWHAPQGAIHLLDPALVLHARQVLRKIIVNCLHH
jgi:hypothetical protein